MDHIKKVMLDIYLSKLTEIFGFFLKIVLSIKKALKEPVLKNGVNRRLFQVTEKV